MRVALLLLSLAAVATAQNLPDKFPAQYTGDSVSEIETVVGRRSMKLAKDQFETTTDWIKRVDQLGETKINGHRLKDAVVVITPACQYNADLQAFTCKAFRSVEDVVIEIKEKQYTSHQRRGIILQGLKKEIEGSWNLDIPSAKQAKIRLAVLGTPVKRDEDALGMLADVVISPIQVSFFDFESGKVYQTVQIGPKTNTPPITLQ